MPDKAKVFAALIDQLRAELAAMERLTAMAIDEATSPESKAENKYDTRSLEASYLAAGQGERLLGLRRLTSVVEGHEPRPAGDSVGLYDLISMGSVHYLLLPDGGGRRVRVDGVDVVVLTPDAPLGEALLGAQPGDVIGDAQRVVTAIA